MTDETRHTRLTWTDSGPHWEQVAGPKPWPRTNDLEAELQPRGDETLAKYAQRVGETVAAYVIYVTEESTSRQRVPPIAILPPTVIEGGQRHGHP